MMKHVILAVSFALCTAPVAAEDFQYQVYFGLSKPSGGAVSLEEWQAYETEFAKAFTGFNVDATLGYYQSSKERSRIITLFMDDCREPSLTHMVQTYVTRFGQDSALVVKSPIVRWTSVTANGQVNEDDSCSAN